MQEDEGEQRGTDQLEFCKDLKEKRKDNSKWVWFGGDETKWVWDEEGRKWNGGGGEKLGQMKRKEEELFVFVVYMCSVYLISENYQKALL